MVKNIWNETRTTNRKEISDLVLDASVVKTDSVYERNGRNGIPDSRHDD